MIRFTCSACQMVLQAPDDRVGVTVACPRCKGQLRVPAASVAPVAAAAPPPQWYYIHDLPKTGPVAFAHLQELALTGRLGTTDMVWRDGMAQWAPASSVNGLFPTKAPASTTAAARSYPGAPPEGAPARRSLFQRFQGVLDQFKNVLANLKDVKAGVLALVPSLPFLAGFLGDFLRPLAPFNFLFFLLSLLVMLTLIGLFLRYPRLLTFRAGAACLACGVVCLIFGLWWGLALFGSSGDKGFLASNVGFVHYIQAAVVTRGENAVATDTTVKGDELSAQVLKEMQAEKDGEKLVEYALKDYPANVLMAEPVGDPKRKKGEKDEPVLQFDLQIGVDLEQYDRIVGKKLLPILEKVAVRKGEVFSGAEAVEASMGSYPVSELTQSFSSETQQRLSGQAGMIRYSKIFEFSDIAKTFYGDRPFDPKEEMLVFANSSRSGTDDKLTWKWFVVPRPPVGQSGRTTVMINLSFRDKEDHELTRDQLELEGQQSLPGRARGESQGAMIFLSPYLVNNRYYTRTLTTTQEIHFTANELARFASIHCTVEQESAGGSAANK